MELEILPYRLSVCRLSGPEAVDLSAEFFFLGKTDRELSLVCRTEEVPAGVTARADGWRGFRVRGVLDFSLVGVLSRLSGVLAENGIGIFAVSTYDTDYILVREEDLDRAVRALAGAGYAVDQASP